MKDKEKKSVGTVMSRGREAVLTLKNRLDIGGDLLVMAREEQKKLDARALSGGLCSLAVSFILARARMAFGTYPLGLALVCAGTGQAPLFALGSALGILLPGAGSPVHIFAYILALAIRFALAFYLSKKRGSILSRAADACSQAFYESLYLRMAGSIPPAFLLGAYLLAEGGFSYHGILGMLFLMIFTPAAVFVYSGAFDKNVRATPFFPIAVAALLFSAVFSLREVSLFGISLGLAAAFFLSAYTAREGGVAAAAAAGLISGFAVSPVYAPLAALSGIVCAALGGVSSRISSAAGAVFAAAVGTFSIGLSSLTSLLPAAAVGSLIFSLADTAGLLPSLAVLKKERILTETVTNEKRESSLSSDIEQISEAFSSISEIFLNLSERVRVPSVLDYKRICDSACDKFCPDCTNMSLCWEREYGTLSDTVAKLAAELQVCGRAGTKQIPEHIRARCPFLGAILDDINLAAAREIEASIENNRAETVSLDYSAFSAVLACALEKNKDEHALDAELSRGLAAAFEARSGEISCKSVTVYGSRVKHIVIGGVGRSALAKNPIELKLLLESVCQKKISAPRIEISESGVNIAFELAPLYAVESAEASASADGAVCGDSIVMFDGRGDLFYSMINDGMGSGKIAALTSSICAVFGEKLLSCGLDAESALKILSSVLRSKGIECSSSVDLAEFDLSRGSVCFIKSGAAPSFVRRAGKLFKLASKTVPIGIMRSFDAEQIKFELEDGDVIVMLSDGVCEDFDGCAWLPTLLTDGWEDDLALMADKIVREGTLNNKKRDDITVGIVRVKRI